MKKYIFLLLVFALGAYTSTVVHAKPFSKQHDYNMVVPTDDVVFVEVVKLHDYNMVSPTLNDVVFVAEVKNPVNAPGFMMISLPKPVTINCRLPEHHRIRWQKLGNNYYKNHPPSTRYLTNLNYFSPQLKC